MARQAVLMLGRNNNQGFTLIELLVALAIIGMLMAAIIPMMQQRPGRERKQFVAQLNSLVQFAWQQSIISRKTHRVLFNFKERQAFVEKVTSSSQAKNLETEKVSGPGSSMEWPSTIIIKQFIVEGYDELARFGSRGAQTIWFYVIPDGLTQQVTINFIDREDKIDNKPQQFGLVLNPFLAQFKEYDRFAK